MDNKWTQYIHYFGLYLIPASIVSGFLIAFCYAIANTYGNLRKLTNCNINCRKSV